MRSKSRLVVALAVTIIFYAPVLTWLVRCWLDDPYYHHGFLIPIISGVILWLRRARLPVGEKSAAGAIIFATGLALYGAGFFLHSPSLAAFSFLIAIWGVISYFCGVRRGRPFAFPILFLIFMIPLPFLSELSGYLQNIATHSAAAMARVAGTSTTTLGNQIILPSADFVVGEPCSGMSTLISLLALAAILVFLLDGKHYRRAILFLLAFPIAIAANALRVASILVIADRASVDLAMSLFHSFSGVILFLIALSLLILFSWLLGCKFKKEMVPLSRLKKRRFSRPFPRRLMKFFRIKRKQIGSQ